MKGVQSWMCFFVLTCSACSDGVKAGVGVAQDQSSLPSTQVSFVPIERARPLAPTEPAQQQVAQGPLAPVAQSHAAPVSTPKISAPNAAAPKLGSTGSGPAADAPMASAPSAPQDRSRPERQDTKRADVHKAPTGKPGKEQGNAGDAWLGFFGNVVGGAIGAGVAIWLWYKERSRERQREISAAQRKWSESKSWLLISLDEVRAEFSSELELVRQHKLSTDAILGEEEMIAAHSESTSPNQGILEYQQDIAGLVDFATGTRRTLPPLQTEYVLWFGNDWCTKYSRLDVSVSNFRRILRSAALPQMKIEAVQQLHGVLNRAANTGSQIDELFEVVVVELRDQAYDV